MRSLTTEEIAFMGKKTAGETDEVRLKKKVAERGAGAEHPEGKAALRSLKKRLKRVQRKRRSLAARKRRATGKGAGAGAAG